MNIQVSQDSVRHGNRADMLLIDTFGSFCHTSCDLSGVFFRPAGHVDEGGDDKKNEMTVMSKML